MREKPAIRRRHSVFSGVIPTAKQRNEFQACTKSKPGLYPRWMAISNKQTEFARWEKTKSPQHTDPSALWGRHAALRGRLRRFEFNQEFKARFASG